MKLVVLGATGGVGSEIVRQALERGHSVTALVRAPERLKMFAGRSGFNVIQGDLLDSKQIEHVIDSHDAVLSGFGPRSPLAKVDRNLLEHFAIALTAVRRFSIVSTAFLFKDAVFPPAYLFGRLFFPSIVADAAAMEEIVAKSGLDWTIVRPPQLTDKPWTGRYRVREGHLPLFGFKISRADVADCMLESVEKGTWNRKVVGVCH